SAIGKGFGRVPSSDRIAFVDSAGGSLASVRTVSFYNTEEGIAVNGYWADTAGAPQTATARLSARRPGPPTLYDPITGQQSPPRGDEDDDRRGPRRPLLLRYQGRRRVGDPRLLPERQQVEMEGVPRVAPGTAREGGDASSGYHVRPLLRLRAGRRGDCRGARLLRPVVHPRRSDANAVQGA